MGILAGIILGLAFFALIAFLVYLFVYKRIQMNHQMRLEMIKQGLDPNVESDRLGSLKAGIVLSGIGVAILFAILLEANAQGDRAGGELVLGLVPLFVGVGLVGFHLFARTRTGQSGRIDYSSDVSEP